MPRRNTLVLLVLTAIGGLTAPAPLAAQEAKKYEDFAVVTKGAKEYDGLFKLYRKDDHLFAEIRPEQFDRPLLAPVAIAKGMGIGGYTLNFDEQWVLLFRKVGDRVFLVRRNVRFKAKPGTPVAAAVETTYTDSVLMALKIRTVNPARNAVVIDLADVFFGDFAGLRLGPIDRERTTWHSIKTFPKNIELEVAATFAGSGPRMMRGDGDAIIDPRGNTVILHYGLVELPQDGYQPRAADDRIGYFLTAVKDFSADSKDSAFVRYVNRWRLERADGKSSWKEGDKLSPPKKKIVFWVEKTVPDEYRAAVREGILEWNKAFEKVGFRDAIEVRQQESEDFDPEDINYHTFRWITTDAGFAMGPSRANPLTGEILDADIIFDASMVRFYQQDRQLFAPSGVGREAPSLIEAARRGWTMPNGILGWNDRAQMGDGKWEMGNKDTPAGALSSFPISHFHSPILRQGLCQCATHKHDQLSLAMAALAARAEAKPGEKLPDDLVVQAVKEVTMHEVGHTLGLRHNFKSSTFLKNEQLHDTAITRNRGLIGSVMDYAPVNLAPKGVKQGDFFTTTIGPYDYWAIEYGYRPLGGGTEGEREELNKIACRGATPGHDYATDEDMFGTADPLVNVWDLGSDPMKYALDRMALAEELLKGLAERVVEKGEGYQRARLAFTLMLRQYGDAAFLTGQFVGGEALNRDHRGDPDGREPQVPVKPAKQREALKFLAEHVLTDKPFQFAPDLLRKLGADRWSHWGNDHFGTGTVDYSVTDRVLAIQRITLRQLLAGDTLSRVQNNALKADKGEAPLTIAEVFRTLTDGIWADLPVKPGDKPAAASSVLRRNLQRAYLRQLGEAVTGRASLPPDARSLARLHLREAASRIDAALAAKEKPDDTVRAHLEELKESIAKVLAASVQAAE
jgi:hypothetical protein